MAWWDHEELKNPEHRSDRYKLTYWGEYQTKEIVATIDHVLKHGPEHLLDYALKRAKAIGYKPVVRRKARKSAPPSRND